MIKNYFSCGNVYVIDDQVSEAQPIINALYKHHIPHVYTDGRKSNLPPNPEQVRLIFLDLNLFPTLNANDKKSFKDSHASILNKLLANKASSYIILIWSKQQDTFLNDFKEIFIDEQYSLKHKAPLEIISLDKQDYFSTVVDEEGITAYSWIVSKENELFDLITEKLSVNEAFKTLSSWETIIKKSGNNTVDYLFEMVKDQEDKVLKLNDIITGISISYLGFENFYKKLATDNQSRTDGFLFALIEMIDDQIEKEIIVNDQYEFTKWSGETEYKKFDTDFKSKLNSKLLISNEKSKKALTGSVFKVSRTKHPYLDIIKECMDPEKISKLATKYNIGKTGEQLTDKNNYFNKRFKNLVSNKEVIPIELNITPLCDIVQKKEKYYRMIPGLLLKLDFKDSLQRQADRNFYSPIIYLEDYNQSYILILDFRFFHSITGSELNKLVKIFSLRKSFVDDIQLKLSNHISRLGVLYL